jgi:hypothetical protein
MEFSMTEPTIVGGERPTPAKRAEDIFRRYPDISAEEAKEAVAFLKKGRHLDIGLVTGIAEIKPNIEAFEEEHRRALGVGWGEYLIFSLIFLLFLAVVFALLSH